MMARFKDVEWRIAATEGGDVQTTEGASLAVLMDIRDELKEIKYRLRFGACPDFLEIPRTLRRISANTAKPRKKKVKK